MRITTAAQQLLPFLRNGLTSLFTDIARAFLELSCALVATERVRPVVTMCFICQLWSSIQVIADPARHLGSTLIHLSLAFFPSAVPIANTTSSCACIMAQACASQMVQMYGPTRLLVTICQNPSSHTLPRSVHRLMQPPAGCCSAFGSICNRAHQSVMLIITTTSQILLNQLQLTGLQWRQCAIPPLPTTHSPQQRLASHACCWALLELVLACSGLQNKL